MLLSCNHCKLNESENFLNFLGEEITKVSSKRPEPDQRKFNSEVINNYITSLKDKFKDDDLFSIFENCFPNTLDTTVEYDELNKDTFIITGDIEAMWLRDTSFQLLPYLDFMNKDKNLKNMIYSAINRQKKSILIDAYPNAFNKENKQSPFSSDETYKKVDGKIVKGMTEKIWERKYELDSTMSTLFLHYNVQKITQDYSFIDEDYLEMLQKIIILVEEQSIGTDEEDESKNGWSYYFQRSTSESFDSLHQGRGNPGKTCGLIRSSFRGSDDATLLPFNIPENAFLVSVFQKTIRVLNSFKKTMRNAKIYRKIDIIIDKLDSISKTVNNSILKHGIIKNNKESYFAYEVDCYGNTYFMDDSNYPSLISLPFLGYFDELNNSNLYSVWENTKKRVLSNNYNPYYFQKKTSIKVKSLNGIDEIEINVNGVGSPHTPRHNIWPLGLIMRGLTSKNELEIIECLLILKNSALNSGFMHESFSVENPENFTRTWFAWANSFFGFFINNVIELYPNIILK